MEKKYKVSVVKCSSYKNQEVKKALEQALRDIDFSFKKNLKVLIKPNILSPNKPEKAITTHPIVIEELCKILKKDNAEIYIGESSSFDTKRGFEISGIGKMSKYARIINFESEEKQFFKISGREVSLPKILFDFDLIINVAKLKTHVFTGVTLCVKNLYGCIPGKLKERFHRTIPSIKKFSLLLYGLNKKINPQLNIIDGVLGLEGLGPGTSGTPKKCGILLAGKRAETIDLIASEIMGFNPYSIYTNKLSDIKRGDIEVIGKIQNLNFKKPPHAMISVFNLLNIFPNPKIKFNYENCSKCKICEKKCPVQAIALSPYPTCNHKKCIRCLCCMEICPNAAVSLEDHWTRKLAKKVYRAIANSFKKMIKA